MSWFEADANTLLPIGISAGITATTDVISKALTVARQGLAVARLYQKALGADAPDVLGILVKAIVDSVEGLLQAGKVHVLFVPMAKVVANDTVQGSTVPPTLAGVGNALGFDFPASGIALSTGANEAYARMAGGRGGNKGFFNTFIQSLTDTLDPNRPQYDSPGDAVVMTVLMAGAPSFSSTVEIAAAFNRIFHPKGNSDLTARTIPTPQNVRCKVVAVPKATQIGVRLDWDAPKEIYTLPFFPGVNMRTTRYAVIRSTNPTAMGARTVFDFFPTRDLREGMTSNDAAKQTKVIAIGSGSNASYVDDDDTLDKNKTYYYTVAWEVAITERGTTTTFKFDKLSNMVKTRTSTPQPTQNSVPPDWTAYGSLLDLVPELAVQVKTMLAQLSVIGDKRFGPASRINNVLDMANTQLLNALARVDELNASVQRFSAVLAQPLPALYATTIEGVGGNALLIGELAARLADTSDENRPPFDGNEYVMGLCIVGGGPRLADIKPITDFLNALFRAPDEANPLLGVLTVIDRVVAEQEVTFGADLRPLPLNADGTVTLPDGSSVDPATIDPNTGHPAVGATQVIGDAGTALVSRDPANPNAGLTNTVTTEDLC